MPWIVFAIAAPALYGITNFIDRFLIEKKVKDPVVLTIFSGLLSFFVGLLVIAARGFPFFPPLGLLVLFLGGTLAEFAPVPYFRALALEDTSRVVPLFQAIPVIVLIASHFLLGETLQRLQWYGFVLVFFGGLLLSLRYLDTKVFALRKSFWYMMAASLLFAAPLIAFKFVVVRQDFGILCRTSLSAAASARCS